MHYVVHILSAAQLQVRLIQAVFPAHRQLKESGAAKIVSLLSVSINPCYFYPGFISAWKGVEPKVMVIEEAGQVLESHILASLVESVQQIIMIGDPLQLRPSVNNYSEIAFSLVRSNILITVITLI